MNDGRRHGGWCAETIGDRLAVCEAHLDQDGRSLVDAAATVALLDR